MGAPQFVASGQAPSAPIWHGPLLVASDLARTGFQPHQDAWGLLEDCVRLMDTHVCDDGLHHHLLWLWYSKALDIIKGKWIPAAELASESLSMVGLA
jgi:hypothetical protein